MLALEFTHASVRLLVAGGPPRSPRLHQLLSEPVAHDQDLDEAVRRLLARVSGPRGPVVCAIPRDQVLTRLMQLPATQPQEVRQMVELTARTQFPDPLERMVVDSHLIEQRPSGSLVQVVACRQELIERYVRAARGAGLDVLCAAPNSWGLLWWYQLWAKDQAPKDPVWIVHVDADHTDVLLLRQGRVLFSRSLAQGGLDWRRIEDTLEPFLQELARSLATCRRDWPGVEAQGFVVTGVGGLEALARALEQRWSKPVASVSLTALLGQVQGAEAFEGSPACLMGLIRADRRQLLNLLPHEARQAQAYGQRMRELTVTGGLLLMTFFLGVSVLLTSIRRQEQAAGRASTNLRQLESATQDLEQKARFIRLVDTTLASRRRTASMLAELFRMTPETIAYDSVMFERTRGDVVVRGSAPATRQVLDYVQALEGSPHWKQVELRYSRRRGSAAGAQVDFEVALKRRD